MYGDALQGVEGDSSGTNADIHGTFLKWCEETKARGCILYGCPGAGKSQVARTVGNTFGKPCVELDFGGTKSKWIGESEANIRRVLQTIVEIGGNSVYLIATTNKMESLKPQMQRRFGTTYYFDLPSREELVPIWSIHRAKYPFVEWQVKAMPDDTNWTGSDIARCCREAYSLHCTLEEAAAHFVPVHKSSRELIEESRQLAHNRFLSASTPGVYKMPHRDALQEGVRALG